jgi:hypothetical protein
MRFALASRHSAIHFEFRAEHPVLGLARNRARGTWHDSGGSVLTALSSERGGGSGDAREPLRPSGFRLCHFEHGGDEAPVSGAAPKPSPSSRSLRSASREQHPARLLHLATRTHARRFGLRPATTARSSQEAPHAERPGGTTPTVPPRHQRSRVQPLNTPASQQSPQSHTSAARRSENGSCARRLIGASLPEQPASVASVHPRESWTHAPGAVPPEHLHHRERVLILLHLSPPETDEEPGHEVAGGAVFPLRRERRDSGRREAQGQGRAEPERSGPLTLRLRLLHRGTAAAGSASDRGPARSA